MVVVDKRRYLIVSTAGYFFGTSVQQGDDDIEDRETLDRFLEQSSCRTLCARPADTNRDQVRLKLTTELPAGRNTLVFFKVHGGTFSRDKSYADKKNRVDRNENDEDFCRLEISICSS